MIQRILASLALAAVITAAAAQQYPARPIRFIVPYPPGGGTDTVARLLNPGLIEQLGEQVVIDNRGGANAIIGTDLAAKAAADGYTMLFCLQASMAVNPTLYQNLPYEPQRDFDPVIHLDTLAMMLAVNPSLPVKTIDDLIKLAKTSPGRLNYSSSGHGSAAHLATLLLMNMTGTKMVHVPFKGGGPALAAVVGGEVQFSIGTLVSEAPHVRAGRLRAVALATARRVPSIPDVPSIAETLPGFDASVWHGVVVPKGTPAAAVKRLNAAFNAVLKRPQVRGAMEKSGVQPVGGTPEEFAVLIKSETAKYEKLLKEMGMAGSSKL